MMLMDTKGLYEKWYQDIMDSQGADTGHIPHTAPFLGGGGGPGGWGCAVYVIPLQYHKVYGDTALLEQGYPAILRWLTYMHTRCEGGLVVREEDGGWCAPADRSMLPEPFVNSYYYIQGLRAAGEIARLLHKDELPWLDERIQRSTKAFINHYFDTDTGDFCSGTGAANAFALNLGLGDERTRDNLIRRYQAAGQPDTGIFGTPVLLERLFREGEGDLAVRLMTNKSPVSFAAMMDSGATTLWEHWEGTASHNHPMFGSAVKLLFTEILGIRQKEGSCGYSDYFIRPADVPSINWAEGFMETAAGKISVRWTRDAEGKIQLEGDHHE